MRRTAAGERVLSLGGAVAEPGSRLGGAPEGALLTPKEREVLVLVLRRCSNAEIAETLYLSLPTVKTHLRNILRKLGAKNHRELFQTRAREASDL
jgi:DNA-binding CsgD family transcriptional regulator